MECSSDYFCAGSAGLVLHVSKGLADDVIRRWDGDDDNSAFYTSAQQTSIMGVVHTDLSDTWQ